MSKTEETGLEIIKTSTVDIIKKATGYVFQPLDNHIEASSFLKLKIQERQDIDDLTKAAFISDSSRIIREYKNQHEVVKEAIEIFLKSKPKAVPDRNDSSNDTIFKILNEARNVSYSEVRALLAKILVGELEIPNSIPKALINVISNLNMVQAHQLNFLSLFVGRKIRNNKFHNNPFLILPPMILPIVVWYEKEDERFPFIIDERALIDMQSISVLVYGVDNIQEIFSEFGIGLRLLEKYSNKHYAFADVGKQTGDIVTINTGKIKLTSTGEHLYRYVIQDASLNDYRFDKKQNVAVKEILDGIESFLNKSSTYRIRESGLS